MGTSHSLEKLAKNPVDMGAKVDPMQIIASEHQKASDCSKHKRKGEMHKASVKAACPVMKAFAGTAAIQHSET